MSPYLSRSLAEERQRDLLEEAKRRHPSWPSPRRSRRGPGRRLRALVSALVTRWGLDEATWPLLPVEGADALDDLGAGGYPLLDNF